MNNEGKTAFAQESPNILAKIEYCIFYLQVSLKLDEKELEFALQDKVMISSILKDGLPSKKK